MRFKTIFVIFALAMFLLSGVVFAKDEEDKYTESIEALREADVDLQQQVDALRLQIESFKISIDATGDMTVAPEGDLILQPVGDVRVESDTTMTKDSMVMGNSSIVGASAIGEELHVGGDTTVMGNAEMIKDIKIYGRLSLLHTSAKIGIGNILQAIEPDAPLASTVNIIQYNGALSFLEFIPAPEGIEKGTMMTLTYSPLDFTGERIDYGKPPIRVINCKGDCSPETKNISLKQTSNSYEMFPGNTLTLVNSYSNIWYEISRSSAQIEVFGIETDERWVPPYGSSTLQIDCVVCNNCASCPDCDEKAIMLVASVDFKDNENLEIVQEATREFRISPDNSFERYYVYVQNNGSSAEEFTVKARCMIP